MSTIIYYHECSLRSCYSGVVVYLEIGKPFLVVLRESQALPRPSRGGRFSLGRCDEIEIKYESL